MPKYLSEEWLLEADVALRASGLCTSDGVRFAVEQQVGEVVFHMVFDEDGASVCAGPAIDPAVVFRQNRDTAVAIALGELSAEEAVLNGEITFEGDPMALLYHRRLLTRAEDVFADVRSRTDWNL
ncbi:SCP2 sterol-binding domain-containing protein [Candidatus Poriferisocius sp.]|uniref:SCP2 sterol-binding domain-containing protein n=1 Tax=Candidatus Poriferisocius sp. TaxID=3101276 RepID=UPI003B590950